MSNYSKIKKSSLKSLKNRLAAFIIFLLKKKLLFKLLINSDLSLKKQ